MLVPRRSGFTLMELLVVFAIVAALAAVVTPQLLKRVDQGKSGAVAQTLDAVTEGILSYRAHVRRYPTHLRFLTSAPDGTTLDLCGRNIPSHFRDEWQGPYLQRPVTSAGLRISDATVQDELVPSTTFTTTTAGELSVHILEVDSAVAHTVERAYDATLDFSAGSVRWTSGGAARGTLEYAIPVRGC